MSSLSQQPELLTSRTTYSKRRRVSVSERNGDGGKQRSFVLGNEESRRGAAKHVGGKKASGQRQKCWESYVLASLCSTHGYISQKFHTVLLYVPFNRVKRISEYLRLQMSRISLVWRVFPLNPKVNALNTFKHLYHIIRTINSNDLGVDILHNLFIWSSF